MQKGDAVQLTTAAASVLFQTANRDKCLCNANPAWDGRTIVHWRAVGPS